MTTPDAPAASAPSAPAGVPAAADGAWHRVHPLTPAVKSWSALVVVLVVFGQEFGRQSFENGGVPTPDGDGPGLPDLGGGVLAGGAAVLVAAVAAVVALMWLSWRMTRYRLTDEAFELHQGVVSRRQRSARIDRLQAVDVVQPLVARVFGLARLSVEVAGSGDSKIELAYLTHAQATSLRAHLLARAAGVTYTTAEAPEAPEHAVFELPVQRLIGSVVLSGAFVSAVVGLLGLVVGVVVAGEPGPFLAGVFPIALGIGGVLWNKFGNGFGFRVATGPDGLRLRHGLLEQRSQTVPPGRVQAVRLHQPLLWRRVGWWNVRVNIAGYGGLGEQQAEGETTLLPVADRAEALLVLSMVVPDLGAAPGEDPRALVAVAMDGEGADGGFVTSPRGARWLDPLAWRRSGYRVTDQVLLVRRGRLHREVDVVPHARTQSLGVTQGPLQRRLGLATFAVHSTPGPVSPVVRHLASARAAELLEEQAVRARAARATAGPERWMAAHPSAPAPDAPPPPAAS